MSAPASWGEVVEASCTGQALGYALGWQNGWTAGYQAAQDDAQEARRAALVARVGVEGIDVLNARRKAAQRVGEHPGAVEPAGGRWSA